MKRDNAMSAHSSRNYPANHLPLAKALRRDLTPAEGILWRHVRGKRFGGFKFRRQQPLGPYIADFLCARVGLIVELDGESHVDREMHDAARQAVLEAMGYRVLRFLNSDVYDDLEMVLENVGMACEAGQPPM